MEKPLKNLTAGRPRHGWEGNIKMDVQEVCCEGVDYIYLAQDLDGFRALLNAKMNYELHKKRRIY